MKNQLQALFAVSLGLFGLQEKAEVRAIDLQKAQSLTNRYSPETLGRISQRGLVFLVDNDNKLYLNATKAKQLISSKRLITREPSTVNLLKEMLKDSVKVDKKDLKDIVLSTQDYAM